MKRIVLCGQTNVGKSLLFNKLCGKKLSISVDQEHTTVDYIKYLLNSETELIDTVGLENFTKSNTVILNSDLIFYMIDGSKNLQQLDILNLNQLNRYKKQIVLLINKSDKLNLTERELEKYPVKEKIHTSALSGYNFDLIKKFFVYEKPYVQNNLSNVLDLPNASKPPSLPNVPSLPNLPNVGLIGRCNSGKTTLLNCILGYERGLVRDENGTTRDSICEVISTIHNQFQLVDTAGYKKEQTKLEDIIAAQRHRMLKECAGIIVLCDGYLGLTKTDKQMINEGLLYGNFLMICVNKKDQLNMEVIKDFRLMQIPDWIPLIYISAKNNDLGNLLSLIDICYFNSLTSIKTDDLNKWFHKNIFNLLDVNKRRVKIKYLVQTQISPITIRYFSNYALNAESKIFLIKQIMKEFNLLGCRLDLVFASKNKNKK